MSVVTITNFPPITPLGSNSVRIDVESGGEQAPHSADLEAFEKWLHFAMARVQRIKNDRASSTNVRPIKGSG